MHYSSATVRTEDWDEDWEKLTKGALQYESRCIDGSFQTVFFVVESEQNKEPFIKDTISLSLSRSLTPFRPLKIMAWEGIFHLIKLSNQLTNRPEGASPKLMESTFKATEDNTQLCHRLSASLCDRWTDPHASNWWSSPLRNLKLLKQTIQLTQQSISLQSTGLSQFIFSHIFIVSHMNLKSQIKVTPPSHSLQPTELIHSSTLHLSPVKEKTTAADL